MMFGALPAAAAGIPQFPQADQPVAQPKPSFFGQGGVGRGIAGSIGDFLLQQAHAQPIYAPAMQDQRREQYQQQQLAAQKDAAWKQWVAQQQYKAANPDPTQFQQDLEAAGIDPNSPQGRALYQQRVTNQADPIQGVPITNPDGSQGLRFIRPSQMSGQQPQSLGATLPQGWTVGGAGPQTPQSFPLYPTH